MKYSCALKLNHIFRRLYHSQGQGNSFLVLYTRPNKTEMNRVGITVSKKLGHAVVRNRVRRRLREIYRIHETQFKSGWDIVVVARSRCVEADFESLMKAYLSLANKAGLLKAGIIVQCVFSLKIIGWISAIAYPITYLIAVLCDTPLYDVPNNLYVYWYLSYIALILIGLVVDLILKNRKSN